jgi:hypothetical protein
LQGMHQDAVKSMTTSLPCPWPVKTSSNSSKLFTSNTAPEPPEIESKRFQDAGKVRLEVEVVEMLLGMEEIAVVCTTKTIKHNRRLRRDRDCMAGRGGQEGRGRDGPLILQGLLRDTQGKRVSRQGNAFLHRENAF